MHSPSCPVPARTIHNPHHTAAPPASGGKKFIERLHNRFITYIQPKILPNDLWANATIGLEILLSMFYYFPIVWFTNSNYTKPSDLFLGTDDKLLQLKYKDISKSERRSDIHIFRPVTSVTEPTCQFFS